VTRPDEQPKPDSRSLYEARQLESIAERWDAKAASWDSNLGDPSCHLNEDDAYARFLTTLADVTTQRQSFCRLQGVVDVGCATGLVLSSIISKFAWGVGVDISPEMVRLAQAKKTPNARFIVGDCFDLDRSVPKAGAVVSRGVLLSHYGWPNASAFLASTRRVLLNDGFLFCDFLNGDTRENYQHAPNNKTYFSATDICKLASEAGFRTASVLGAAERRVQILMAS
jgi:SAM-dependent methyltransferase